MQRLIQFMLQIVIQIMLQIVMQIAENIISEVVADYIWDKIVHLDDKEEKNKMDIIYGDVIAHGIKSNNWKRMHEIPLKANPRFKGGKIFTYFFDGRYVSKRSRKKRKKMHFRGCINPSIEYELHNNPKFARIYHRYGAWRKKLRKKISRKWQKNSGSEGTRTPRRPNTYLRCAPASLVPDAKPALACTR